MTIKRLALAVAAGAFTTALVGGAAFAAFQPAQTAEPTAVTSAPSTGASPDRGPADRLKAILAPLVANGTISQAQADAVLKAVHDAAAAKKPEHRGPGYLGDVLKVTSDYLGVPAATVAAQLRAGKSLAEIADGMPPHSRAGLVDALTTAANKKVDAAVSEKKLTTDQATALRAKLATEIGRLVDHKATRAPKAPKG